MGSHSGHYFSCYFDHQEKGLIQIMWRTVECAVTSRILTGTGIRIEAQCQETPFVSAASLIMDCMHHSLTGPPLLCPATCLFISLLCGSRFVLLTASALIAPKVKK